MLLNKTALAHSALQAGSSAGLSLAERRILIVTDGKRTLNEVMAMLGPDILPAIDRLLKDGYIRPADARAAAASAPASGVAGAFTGLLRATTDALQARTEQIRAGSPRPTPTQADISSPPHAAGAAPSVAGAGPGPVPARGQRRSLVAAKMYMIDMLSLQRDPDAVERKARIQFCGNDDALIEAVLDGLQLLLRLTNDSYGQRVLARLAEVLPEPLLPRLEAVTVTRAPREAAPQLKLVGG
ncbi:hypothetical protein [Thermomonas fusca]|uniref:Uncharacterized protein n=1 Tax=Thermomonas fusca TaxID=215690 RepID=A0A5R9PHK7_9GAMM|nr:hypothetical protein [Thermomonas fusca]TLX22547.1 hypothetical protein E5S66_00490 [Thermomonas fusca]